MVFAKRLREGIRRGEITCSVRIWKSPHVKVGNRYRMEDGEIEVDSIEPMGRLGITPALARESGFLGLVDLLRVAKHGKGENVYLVRLHYVGARSKGPSQRKNIQASGGTKHDIIAGVPNKTTENTGSVEAFVRKTPSEETRQDCAALIEVMSAITKCEAKMWGASIVGFDTFHYKYADGKPGEICLIGFSPRKQNLVLYVTDDHERDADLLAKLGKIKTGKGCIYVNRLSDLHMPTLKQLVRRAVKARRAASA